MLPFADAREAHLMLEGVRPHPKGKIVLPAESERLEGASQEDHVEFSLPPSPFPIPCSRKRPPSILRENSTDLLFNHSLRVYLFAAEQGRRQKLRFDAELLYVAAAFHDLGLIRKFSSPNERFEVDGANAARQFLSAHDVPEERMRTVWEAIALHTTPGIPQHMRPEVAAALFRRRS